MCVGLRCNDWGASQSTDSDVDGTVQHAMRYLGQGFCKSVCSYRDELLMTSWNAALRTASTSAFDDVYGLAKLQNQ